VWVALARFRQLVTDNVEACYAHSYVIDVNHLASEIGTKFLPIVINILLSDDCVKGVEGV
jgi:hypothetical protein